jgi:hypothetical protein
MASYTENFSEVWYPLLTENADSIGVGTANSAWGAMTNYHRAVFFMNVGDMGQASTLDVQLRQATDAAGAGAKVIANEVITQLTQAAGDGNQLVCIEIRSEELDAANNFDFIGVQTVVGGAAIELSWTLFAGVPRYAPTPTTNWEEIVNV